MSDSSRMVLVEWDIKKRGGGFMPNMIKGTTPIIKLVGDWCNLRCSYCFYFGDSQKIAQVIPSTLLEKFLREYLSECGGKARFIWHGGEPTLAGIKFFEKILEMEKRYGQGVEIRNHIQTNVTMIDSQWASFLKANDFKVGVSIDGCESSHNRHRRNTCGEGSFSRTCEGFKELRKHGLNPGVIQTLTKSNLGAIREDFDFFTHGLELKSWSINVYSEDGSEGIMSRESVHPFEWGEYLCQLFDLWLAFDDPGLSIRELDNTLAGLCGKKPSSCSFNGSCGRYFCLNSDGEIYLCDRFSSSESNSIGNLEEDSLENILSGEKNYKTRKEVLFLPKECSACEWLKLCNNGCSAMKDSSSQYRYCESRKMLFRHVKGKLDELGFETQAQEEIVL